MSQWTHVSGVLRLDGMPMLPKMTEMDVRQILGPMCLFDAWDESSTLPRGSEGSLQYNVLRAGNGMVLWTVPVWGDLRDYGYEDARELEPWLLNIAKNWPLVRSAHLLVEVEGSPPYFLIVDNELDASAPKVIRRIQA